MSPEQMQRALEILARSLQPDATDRHDRNGHYQVDAYHGDPTSLKDLQRFLAYKSIRDATWIPEGWRLHGNSRGDQIHVRINGQPAGTISIQQLHQHLTAQNSLF